MLAQGQGRRELECKRMEVEPTGLAAGNSTRVEVELTELAAGSSTAAAAAVAFAAAVVAVPVKQTTVGQYNSTWGYKPGNIVKSSYLGSFLKKDAKCKLRNFSFHFISIHFHLLCFALTERLLPFKN